MLLACGLSCVTKDTFDRNLVTKAEWDDASG